MKKQTTAKERLERFNRLRKRLGKKFGKQIKAYKKSRRDEYTFRNECIRRGICPGCGGYRTNHWIVEKEEEGVATITCNKCKYKFKEINYYGDGDCDDEGH